MLDFCYSRVFGNILAGPREMTDDRANEKAPPMLAERRLLYLADLREMGFRPPNSRKKIWQMVRAGEFPPPLPTKKSSRIAWVDSDIINWIAARKKDADFLEDFI
jgi:predicted DNA-binding transcriptional regulator AlpA